MTITISKPKVESYNCELCGPFTCGTFTVSTPHGKFEHEHNGHFGCGEWNGEIGGMYLLAVKDMFNAHYIHLEMDHYSNTYGIRYELYKRGVSDADRAALLEATPNRSITLLVQESKRKLTLEVDNSIYFFPPSVWFDAIEYYTDYEYIDYDALFKNVFDQLNLLHSDS
jgi:hypothetical protein